jgi:hypothetical protein
VRWLGVEAWRLQLQKGTSKVSKVHVYMPG